MCYCGCATSLHFPSSHATQAARAGDEGAGNRTRVGEGSIKTHSRRVLSHHDLPGRAAAADGPVRHGAALLDQALPQSLLRTSLPEGEGAAGSAAVSGPHGDEDQQNDQLASRRSVHLLCQQSQGRLSESRGANTADIATQCAASG